MLRNVSWLRVGAAWLMFASAAQAATLFETTEIVGAQSAGSIPAMRTFTVTTPGDYTLTLTDLQTPAALGSLHALVTRDLQAVTTAAVTYATTAPPTPVSVTFAASAGTYRVHVVGALAEGQSTGGFGIRIAPTTGGASVLEVVDSIESSAQAGAGLTLQSDFTIAAAGDYTLSVQDHAFPSALAATEVLLLQQTEGAPLPVLTAPGTFAAQPGTYTLLIVATADSTTQAGLYSVAVDGGPAATRVFGTTRSVGALPTPIEVTLSAGDYSFALDDLEFPDPLSSYAAIVLQQGVALGAVTTADPATLTASSGVAHIYAFASAAPPLEIGAYALTLRRDAQVVHESVRLVDNSNETTTAAIYSVTSPTALAAGNHRIALEDVGVMSNLAGLQAAVVQSATVLARLNSPSELELALQATPLKILVAASPPASGQVGLFALDVRDSSGASVFETTQGVGGYFKATPVVIREPGEYDLTLMDLQFPKVLGSSALAVTQGKTIVAQVFGAGTLTNLPLAAGTYVLNVQGTPDAEAGYGAYGLRVASSTGTPPTMSLTASATSVKSGQSATLQWTSTNAVSCAASNGWSGSKGASGSESVGPLRTTTTFELVCSGPSGSATASVTIAVSGASLAARRGGGGSLDVVLLALFALLACYRGLMNSSGRARRSSDQALFVPKSSEYPAFRRGH